jgi:hypothetical protein
VFTGDTGQNDALWRIVNRIANLKYLIIETAFSNKERQLAEISRHLCPATLAEELAKLERNPEIYITHLKPGEIEPTMREIEECAGDLKPRMLQNNLVLEFSGRRATHPATEQLCRPCPARGLSPSASPSSPRWRWSSARAGADPLCRPHAAGSRYSCSRARCCSLRGGGTLVVVGGERRDAPGAQPAQGARGAHQGDYRRRPAVRRRRAARRPATWDQVAARAGERSSSGPFSLSSLRAGVFARCPRRASTSSCAASSAWPARGRS